MTKKSVKFQWTSVQQITFEEIKKRLVKPPVLHLPSSKGRFQLFSDTSSIACGASLWQKIDGKPKLIGYASKRMPIATKNYSPTELELCGLAINIASFKHLLAHMTFDAVTDHNALTYIMKSKTEPPTNRIKRLLEILSQYEFCLYYIKGRDMKLSDFLSRVKIEDNHPNEVIPISFILQDTSNVELIPEIFDSCRILCGGYYSLKSLRYHISTRSTTKATGNFPPPVHGTQKQLDPHKKPEQKSIESSKTVKSQPNVEVDVQPTDKLPPRKPQVKGRAGQGRAGIKKNIMPKTVLPVVERIPQKAVPHKVDDKLIVPENREVTNYQPREVTNFQPRSQQIPHKQKYEKPFYVDPLTRPPPKPVIRQDFTRPEPLTSDHEQKVDADEIIPEIRTDIEESSPYQESPYDETILRPTDKDLMIPPSLESQIKEGSHSA